jgi:hypothetical protein
LLLQRADYYWRILFFHLTRQSNKIQVFCIQVVWRDHLTSRQNKRIQVSNCLQFEVRGRTDTPSHYVQPFYTFKTFRLPSNVFARYSRVVFAWFFAWFADRRGCEFTCTLRLRQAAFFTFMVVEFIHLWIKFDTCARRMESGQFINWQLKIFNP